MSDDGVGVTMSTFSHAHITESEFIKMRERMVTYALNELPQLARRHGEITIPLKREDRPSKATIFSLGLHNKKSKKFGLLFLYVSPQGRAAQIVVEGHGSPEDKLPYFHEFVATGQWSEEPNSSP